MGQIVPGEYMSPKRERRKRAREEAARKGETGIQWLGILLVLCGAGMFASGLYLSGILPPRFFPRIQHFWEPTATALHLGVVGDLLTGGGIILLGASGIRKRLAKRALYIVMACAFAGLVADMLGGLYGISAQAAWYLSLFTVLFRR